MVVFPFLALSVPIQSEGALQDGADTICWRTARAEQADTIWCTARTVADTNWCAARTAADTIQNWCTARTAAIAAAIAVGAGAAPGALVSEPATRQPRLQRLCGQRGGTEVWLARCRDSWVSPARVLVTPERSPFEPSHTCATSLKCRSWQPM